MVAMARLITIQSDKRSKQLAYYYRRKLLGGTIKEPRNPFRTDDFKRRLFSKLKNKKNDAKRGACAFDLDLEWLTTQPDHCAVSGIAFSVSASGPLTPSFDKIDPKGGYTKTNTRLVCLWVNTAKMHWPDEDIKKYIVLAGEHIKASQSNKSPV